MDFEKYYLKLPDFIKYNPKVLKTSLNISRKLKNRNDVALSNHQFLNFLFTCCDIRVKGDFRNIQLLLVELLRFIDNVCDKYDLDYWLGFGNLLGAVRHEGFIPWDDDLDLAMPRADYNKLIEVLPDEINKYEYLKDNCGLTLLLNGNKNFFKDFNSVYDAVDLDNNEAPSIFQHFLQIGWLKPFVKIDIFPMDFILDEKVEVLNETFLPKKFKFHFDMLNENIDFFKELELRKEDAGFTNSKTNFFSDSFESVYHWRVRIFEYDKTFPLETINFEGYEFKCPKDYDSHLKVAFGDDYMNIPVSMESHDTLSFVRNQFKSKKALDESFAKSINYLKELNEKFE